MEKKGIFFTFLSILFSALFLVVALNETRTLDLLPISSSIAVTTVNSFVKNLEQDHLEKIAKIAGERTILTVLCEENRTKSYVRDLEHNAASLAMWGNFSNWTAPNTECSIKLMSNYTLTEHIEKIRNLTRSNMNIYTNISASNLTFMQEDPWNVLFLMNVSFSAESVSSSWSRNKTVIAKISILELDDPVYSVGSLGTKRNTIRGVAKKIWYVTDRAEFENHLANMTYYENPSAPSFLMRMQNQSSGSSCCGISSLVNPLKMGAPVNENQSFVDFYYFNKAYENCGRGSLFNLTGPAQISARYPPFKLDFQHLFYYNYSNSSVQVC